MSQEALLNRPYRLMAYYAASSNLDDCTIPVFDMSREGDIFGDEHFGAEAKDVQETPFRTATAVSRTTPCELLVIPLRYGV